MGMYPEHLIEIINEDLQESIYDESLNGMKAEDFENPINPQLQPLYDKFTGRRRC